MHGIKPALRFHTRASPPRVVSACVTVLFSVSVSKTSSTYLLKRYFILIFRLAQFVKYVLLRVYAMSANVNGIYYVRVCAQAR